MQQLAHDRDFSTPLLSAKASGEGYELIHAVCDAISLLQNILSNRTPSHPRLPVATLPHGSIREPRATYSPEHGVNLALVAAQKARRLIATPSRKVNGNLKQQE